MELVKKKIHMDRINGRAGTQIVLEEDVNISDNRPDANYLLSSKGEIILEEVRPGENTVNPERCTSDFYLSFPSI